MRVLIALSLILFSVVLADVAVAQGRSVQPGKEAEAWAGVGILQVRGGGENVRFLAGWRDGITAAERKVVRIVAHRGYDPTRPYNNRNIAADLAIVELELPIYSDAAPSYPRMDKVRIGEPVSVVSFSGRRSNTASINDSCEAGKRNGDILLLSCESYGGMSGAPIFSYKNGKPQIVALISGSRTSQSGKSGFGSKRSGLSGGNASGRKVVRPPSSSQ